MIKALQVSNNSIDRSVQLGNPHNVQPENSHKARSYPWRGKKCLFRQLGLQLNALNQLRYDLREMKIHGLIQYNRQHYSYLLTDKGMPVRLYRTSLKAHLF
jgi:hypothetical protein